MGALVGVLVLLAWVALVVALWIRPLMDASRRPHAAYAAIGRTRMVTIWLILLSGWVGGGYYLVRIRPDLVAAEKDEDRQPEAAGILTYSGGTSTGLPHRGTASAWAASSGPAPSADRELFIRNIPPDIVRVARIPLASAFPPLECSRQDVVDAVRGLEPDAETSHHRLTVVRPGVHVTISFPMQDPLSEVLLRVRGGSDARNADDFIGQLLTRLHARAFDTSSPTLVFSSPNRPLSR